jgi:hypothetical protein
MRSISVLLSGGVLQSQAPIDFESDVRPLFVGHELKLSGTLTVFGGDLPEFAAWALKNGATAVRHIEDAGEYFANEYGLVAHDFGQQTSLGNFKEIGFRIQTLTKNCQRLVLFVDIKDYCTVEEVRKVLRSALPDLTFRILYPRGIYKTSGVRVVKIERRRPRVFLVMGGEPMAGKTETSLWFGDASNMTVVHGDEYLLGIQSGDIGADDELRRRITSLFDAAPFDGDLFARFVAHIPAFERNEDIVFDLVMPSHMHLSIAKFFEQRGFFPILCLTPADQARMDEQDNEVRNLCQDLAACRRDHVIEIAACRRNHELEIATWRREFLDSTSWKLTAPLRSLGHGIPALARAGRLCLDRVARMLAFR